MYTQTYIQYKQSQTLICWKRNPSEFVAKLHLKRYVASLDETGVFQLKSHNVLSSEDLYFSFIGATNFNYLFSHTSYTNLQ